jgi:4-methyl-5(b-hydroxyethyl)-thiazole monophosphate biosynthesis
MSTVLIPLAQGCEELEAITLIDILRRAGIKVITTSLSNSLHITASRGVGLTADTCLSAISSDTCDMVILPGGQPGTDNLNANDDIHALIKRHYQSGKAIAAICAAPLVLAHAGLLDNKITTCFPGSLLTTQWPDITISTQPIVIDGNILTAQGPGTAMDFALVIIEYLCDRAQRDKVEADLIRPNHSL